MAGPLGAHHRAAPGTQRHLGPAVDDDCLALDGALLLGDNRLRAADCPLAPAGGAHCGEMSDVGVLVFRGNIDPVPVP